MKQHMSLSKLLTITLFTVLIFAPCLSAGVSAPADVLKAAQEGLHNFSEAGNLSHAGRQLGSGFQVHSVNPHQLLDRQNETLEALVVPTGVWRFIVTSKGAPCGLLTVAKVNGSYQAVSFGGAELAGEISAIKESWPKNKGYNFRFIRIYQARSDLMEIQENSLSFGFAPLKSAKMALSLETFELGHGKLVYNSEILEPLRDIVSDVIEKHQNKNEIYQEEK